MGKVNSLSELRSLRESVNQKVFLRDCILYEGDVIQIKIAMATCSIVSGARETMKYISEELVKRNLSAKVSQTGCMGYCYAEPTVEVKIPGKIPIVFGYVNLKKADEIIEKYIRKGELVDGIIPMNFQTIDEHQI